MSPDPLPLKCATSFGVSPYLSSQMVDALKGMESGRSCSPRIRFNKVLFPELGPPSKYRQVKIRREKEKKKVRMGGFHHSYVEQENLLPRSFAPQIPYKTPFPFFFLFVFIQNYSSCCPPSYSFHPEISSRLAILCATLKRQNSVRGIINK